MKARPQKQKYGTTAIQSAKLEPIPFRFVDPKTLISFTCPEGTSLCPRSGFPDFWTAHIWYAPSRFIVELKSLKLYLNKFRDQSHYHEELAHLIFQDLKKTLKPDYLKVVLDFTRRGNIQTDVILEEKVKSYSGPVAPEWAVRRGFR